MESIKKQMTPIRFREQELNKSKGILDDFAVRKNVATKEGSIEKIPVNDSDIVNKRFVDSSINIHIEQPQAHVDYLQNNGDIATGNYVFDGSMYITGNLIIDTNTLATDNINHRVGIGTTTPSEELDVVGKISATSVISGAKIVSTTIVEASGDVAGGESRISITNVASESISTGTGTIKLLGATNRNSSGWMKVYVNGNVRYIPYFTTITG